MTGIFWGGGNPGDGECEYICMWGDGMCMKETSSHIPKWEENRYFLELKKPISSNISILFKGK